MSNVIRRYDNIIISPRPNIKESTKTTEEPKTNLLITDVSVTKAKRQDDTPPLGSLGGLKPITIYTPKVKVKKVKNKKPAPGTMKIFDSEGRQWGRQKWKERAQKSSIEAEVK